MTNLRDLLVLHEGNKTFPYVDTVGKVTIGVGFNLTDVGLFPEEIEFILQNRIDRVQEDLERTNPWINELDEVRHAVLLDMGYNLGVTSLNKFKRTLGAVRDGDYTAAAVYMLESLWAKQVGYRAERLAKMMETGEWPKL